MKKKLCLFLAIALVLSILYVPIPNVKAESNLVISGVPESVDIGKDFDVTISGPDGGDVEVLLQLGGGLQYVAAKNDGFAVGNASGATLNLFSTGGTSVTVTLRATSGGTGTITASVTEGTVSYGAGGAKVTVANASAGGNNSGENENSSSNDTDSNNGDNSLSALTLSAGSLSPAFSSKTTNYTAKVDYSVTNLAVSATPSNPSATIASVTGNEDLKVGENTVSIVVKAGNGVTATYTIKVTRRTEDDPENSNNQTNPDEQEQPTAENTGVGDGKFQIEGQTYVPTETIPEEVIPTDFTPSTIAFGETTYSCLNFSKGNLTLLYLVPEGSEDGTGVLYVYDAKSNSIYQFVKLATESHYVIVLLPNVEDIPEGYSESFLAIEGKGQVAVYQPTENEEDLNTDTKQPDSQNSETETDKSLGFVDAIGECVASFFGLETVQAAEPTASDFYLMYCMNDEGETGWYQYDSVEGTYQRYDTQNMTDKSLTDKYDDAMNKIKKLTQRNWLLIIGMIIGTVIFVIIIIVLAVKKKGKHDVFDDELDDDFKSLPDEDEIETESEEENVEDSDDEIEVEFYEMEKSTEDTEEELDSEENEEDDEVEVEFYEMDPADHNIEDTQEESPKNAEEPKDDIEEQLETIVIPSRDHADEQFGDAAEEIQAKYGKENVRVTKRSMMDKFLDKMSLDNGEDLDEEFEENFDSKADLNGDGEADGEELLAASVAKIKEKQQERHTERMEKLQEELEQATERLKEKQKEEKVVKKKKPEVKIQDLDDDDDDLEFLDLN